MLYCSEVEKVISEHYNKCEKKEQYVLTLSEKTSDLIAVLLVCMGFFVWFLNK